MFKSNLKAYLTFLFTKNHKMRLQIEIFSWVAMIHLTVNYWNFYEDTEQVPPGILQLI